MRYEVVISCALDGGYNRAPIGVHFRDRDVNLYLYEGSHTYQILKREDYFVVNVTSPYLIAQSVYDDEGNYSTIEYNSTILPYISEAYKIYVVKIVKRRFKDLRDEYGDTQLMGIQGRILLERDINNPPLTPYSRADGLIVEMAVLYSRLAIVKGEKREEIVRRMKEYFEIIKKVGDKRYIQLGERFLEEVKKYK
ncbi:MAG TPA: DUF447 family protein [Methanothermococcus okinawensis]|uniref:DUF447 family protein n=1 Tax=Methanothermococcus okinawensis TaxID=155863 RepID=A0A832ZB22_9EURY|nr:DUF447 family protein [Methanothermococcus okinawensis]